MKLEDLSRLQDIDDRKLSNNPNHNFFEIKTEEFFSDTDQRSKNFVLHMRYAEIIQNNLCDLWDRYNELFHEHKRESESDPNSPEKTNLYHFDVYRISDSDELEYTNYPDYFYGDGICLIEWAELIKDIIPDPATQIFFYKNLNISESYRLIKLI